MNKVYTKDCPACGEAVEITTSDAAKAMRAGRKTELTSEQAREIQKKRKNWPSKRMTNQEKNEHTLDLSGKNKSATS
jgi:hypothetical protein